MKIIHKKLVPASHGYHVLTMPAGAKILSVGSSGMGSIPIYAQLDNEETNTEKVHVFVSMTNLLCTAEDHAKFLGTCQIDAQSAAHVFLL